MHTASDTPVAKPVAYLVLRGTTYPILRHGGKLRLPVDAVTRFMGLQAATGAIVAQSKAAYDIVTLAVTESTPLAGVFAAERTRVLATIPLDCIGLLLTVLTLLPWHARNARELASIVLKVREELDASNAAGPARAGADEAVQGTETTVLTVTLEIDGQNVPSKQVIGEAITSALAAVLGGQPTIAAASVQPSPTKH